MAVCEWVGSYLHNSKFIEDLPACFGTQVLRSSQIEQGADALQMLNKSV